jgi:hypothetical protein
MLAQVECSGEKGITGAGGRPGGDSAPASSPGRATAARSRDANGIWTEDLPGMVAHKNSAGLQTNPRGLTHSVQRFTHKGLTSEPVRGAGRSQTAGTACVAEVRFDCERSGTLVGGRPKPGSMKEGAVPGLAIGGENRTTFNLLISRSAGHGRPSFTDLPRQPELPDWPRLPGPERMRRSRQEQRPGR